MEKATSLYGIEHAMIVASLSECATNRCRSHQFLVRREVPGNRPNVLIIHFKKSTFLKKNQVAI